MRGSSSGADHWHACGIAALRQAKRTHERKSVRGWGYFDPHAVDRPVLDWMKRAAAALLFAGGEGWDFVRAELNLTKEDELWLERWRS